MNTIFTLVFAGSITLLGASGCKKHDAASPATMGSGSASGSAAMTGSAMSGSAATTNAGSATMTGSATAMGSTATPDVPTPVDFETQAATDITDKNLESQLDKVEKDLGK